MASEPMSIGSSAQDPPPVPDATSQEPKYGGHTRFELELEVSKHIPHSPSLLRVWLTLDSLSKP